MERRDRSVEALEELTYIDSLDDDIRAQSLVTWVYEYLSEQEGIDSFDLDEEDLQRAYELFFKNINFLKQYRVKTLQELKQVSDTRKFFSTTSSSKYVSEV
jgi:hypothetical protein